MKKLSFILMLMCMTHVADAQIPTTISYYEQFPAYEAVLDHYFQLNAIDIKKARFIDFAKQTDGWYVNEHDFADFSKVTSSQKVWDAKEKKFENVLASPGFISDLEQDEKIANYLKEQVLKRYGADVYDESPVFGYDGYEREVAIILESQPKLSASHRNILARAYSQVCDKMMLRLPSEQYKNTFAKYFESGDADDVSQKSLAAFVESADKALRHFKTLTEEYPDFSTIVGNIKIKYWNEHIARFYDLLQLQQPELAQKYINNPLYDDFIITYGKNMLNSCGKRGILFTEGDLDTYAALYVQAAHGHRRDVSVVNPSLAALDYHLAFQARANKLPHTVSFKDYEEVVGDLVLFESMTDTIPFLKYMNDLKTSPAAFQKPFEDYTFLTIPSRSISIPVRNRGNIALLFGGTYQSDKEMYAQIRTTTLTKAQFFMLDMITTNQWERPVYFSMGTSGITRLFLNKYLSWEGLVYQLMPKSGADRDKGMVLYNMLKYELAEPGAIYTDINQPNSAYIQYLYMFYDATRLAPLLQQEAELETLLNKLTKYFKPNEVSYQDFAAFFADSFYRIGQHSMGDMILEKRAKEVKEKLKQTDLTGNLKTKLNQERNYLISMSGKSQREDFPALIKGILELGEE